MTDHDLYKELNMHQSYITLHTDRQTTQKHILAQTHAHTCRGLTTGNNDIIKYKTTFYTQYINGDLAHTHTSMHTYRVGQ